MIVAQRELIAAVERNVGLHEKDVLIAPDLIGIELRR